MTTIIRAPYPNFKVTSVLPSAEFNDSRANESTIVIKRTMTGRTITYTRPSVRQTLVLPFQLTRMKSLELEAFINSYQAAEWQVTLHDGSVWKAQLVGQPISRTGAGRIGDISIVGKELIDVTLTLSAEKLS